MKILYPLSLSFLLAVASAVEETRLPLGGEQEQQHKQQQVRALGYLKDGVTPRRLVKTYTNNNNSDRRIEFSDLFGKRKGWGKTEVTDRTVTVEAKVEIVGDEASAICSYGIRGLKHDGKMDDDPEMWINCKTRGGDPADLVEEVRAMRRELEDDVSEMCGEKIKMCPPNFVQGILGYIETSLITRGEFPTLRQGKTRGGTRGGTRGRTRGGTRGSINNKGAELRGPSTNEKDLEDHDHDHDHDHDRKLQGAERKLTHTCSDSFLGDIDSSNYPRSGDANCPTYTSTSEGSNGATCMCPWKGGGKEWAYFDAGNSGTKLAWLREYGGDSVQCAGRCGAKCNSADKEAFVDCFDHDSCVDFFGGSVLGDSSNCGDEFDRAADDYIVSYGWCCCTCNIWIGCAC